MWIMHYATQRVVGMPGVLPWHKTHGGALRTPNALIDPIFAPDVATLVTVFMAVSFTRVLCVSTFARQYIDINIDEGDF